jgi:peptidyl-prolyl cis-trans isomerase C
MMESLLGKAAREGATEAAMKQVYDEAAAKQTSEEEISARHILVPTEDEAKAALKRVRGGEDFAKVADDVSKDPGSKGGDLGWFTRDRMVPEFGDAAFKLKKGEISEPVKSQFGWHIIKVEERRRATARPFDDVKQEIREAMLQEEVTAVVQRIRGAAQVERLDQPPANSLLNQAAPPPPAQPTPTQQRRR